MILLLLLILFPLSLLPGMQGNPEAPLVLLRAGLEKIATSKLVVSTSGDKPKEAEKPAEVEVEKPAETGTEEDELPPLGFDAEDSPVFVTYLRLRAKFLGITEQGKVEEIINNALDVRKGIQEREDFFKNVLTKLESNKLLSKGVQAAIKKGWIDTNMGADFEAWLEKKHPKTKVST